jgi:very-short-patch-repair endonuclease
VILDSGYRVKGIIEIDDNSHNASDRKERDDFVDLVLSQTGYKVLRTRSLTDEILDNFLQTNGIQGANTLS